MPKSLRRQMGAAVAVGDVPARIELLPVGRFSTADRRGEFNLSDPAAVIARSMARAPGGHLLIDFGHGVQGAAEKRSDAAGWITALEVEGNRVMASVEWTPEGEAALRGRAYRFVSPVFFNSSDREVVLIGGAGLVNDPGLPQLRQLACKEVSGMLDQTTVAEALGLDGDADEAAIMAALAALRSGDNAPEGPVLASVLKAAGVSSLTEETARQICARLTEGPDPSQYVPASALGDVTRQLAALRKQVGDAAVEAVVSEARDAGKLIPTMEGWARQYASRDLDGFRSYLADAPVLVERGRLVEGVPPVAAGADGLTLAERQMCARCGVTPEAFLATKKQEAA